jgi:bifunctional DNase/RNase
MPGPTEAGVGSADEPTAAPAGPAPGTWVGGAAGIAGADRVQGAEPGGPGGEGPGEDEPARFVVVELVSVDLVLPAQYPVVTLQEAEVPHRQLRFAVGLADGTSLAQALARVATPRPLTHELFAAALGRLHVDVIAVRLVGRRGATYLAELDLMSTTGREILSCRPTDGLGLALRMPVVAPVLVDERLFAEGDDLEPARPL